MTSLESSSSHLSEVAAYEGLVAWVQPIVALTTGTVAGYEALARFRDRRSPTGEVFERAWALGHGPALEARALSAALALPGRPSTAYLGVNVSPRAMESEAVRAALDVDLEGIMVEITEAHYVPNNQLQDIAAWLRERGARLGIDDVGTGYAGLERLITLEPDLIKLDRSLVVRLPEDPVSRVMVESLVRFAARSGAAVCAEGIETRELLGIVAELDISYGQGFLLGRPQQAWTTPTREAAVWAAEVHREALNATPKQSLFLDDFVLLERLAERFSEAEELEDVHHAVAAMTQLVGADDVAIDLMEPGAARVQRLNHRTWDLGPACDVADLPLIRWSLDTRRAKQVLATDAHVDESTLDELPPGFSGLLVVPVITRGDSLGALSFYRLQPVPWSLNQIRLARIGASQLAATLDRLLLREISR